MSEIHVSCKDQVLKLTKAPIIASGGVNETKVVFTFCEKWDGFAKTALFYVDADHKYYAILDENNICILPWEVCAENGSFYFTVFGVKEDIRRTASVVKYKVGKGVEVDEMFPSDPTPEVYDQIIALLSENKELTENFISEAGASIEAANEATVNANAIAQDMEEKRDSGYFNGEKGDPGDKDAVLYTEQTLTEAQKTQARENIGAASQAEADFFHSRLTDGSLVLEDTKTSDSYTLRVTRGKMKLGDSTILTNEDEPRILEGAKAGTVLYTQQDLTEEQKTCVLQNIGAVPNGVYVKADEEQKLTLTQMYTARYNIYAASVEDVTKRTEYDGFVDEDVTSTLTFEEGYYYNTVGKIKDANGALHCTSLIPVKAGDKFKITTTYGYAAVLVAEFDSTQTMVSYQGLNEGGSVKVTDYEYTVPSGISYIAINNRYPKTSPMVLKKVVVDSVKHRIAELEKGGGGAGIPGKDGITPEFSIGEVETLPAGSEATATITGTKENPVLNLGIPKGEDGKDGTGGSVDIPSALPNPHKLTFTGAVNAEYDGSTPVEVEIPRGGGELELLHEVTLTEETKMLEFSLSQQEELFIYLKTVCPEGVTTKQVVNIDVLDASNFATRITLTDAVWNNTSANIVSCLFWKWRNECPSPTGYYVVNGAIKGFSPYANKGRPAKCKIYATTNFGIGTVIQIYGR